MESPKNKHSPLSFEKKTPRKEASKRKVSRNKVSFRDIATYN